MYFAIGVLWRKLQANRLRYVLVALLNHIALKHLLTNLLDPLHIADDILWKQQLQTTCICGALIRISTKPPDNPLYGEISKHDFQLSSKVGLKEK